MNPRLIKIIVVSSLVAAVCVLLFQTVDFTILIESKPNQSFTKELMISTFQHSEGWGYAILVEEEPIIRQPYIPAVSGVKPFKTECQARKAGQLVIKKINKGGVPLITYEELDSLGVVIE